MRVMKAVGIGTFWLVASAAMLPAITPASADEVFLCDDQSLIYVTSKNRAAMADHPCVRNWFERNREYARPVVKRTPLGTVISQTDGPAPTAEAKPADDAGKPAEATTTTAAKSEGDDERKPSTVKFGKRKRSF